MSENERLMERGEARLEAYKSLVEAQTTLNYTGDSDLEQETKDLAEQLRERMEDGQTDG